MFAIEILVCPRCGAPRRILGAVAEPHAVRRLLAALGLAAGPPLGSCWYMIGDLVIDGDDILW